MQQKLVQDVIARAAARMALQDSAHLWLRELQNKSAWNWLIEQTMAQQFATRLLQKESDGNSRFPRLSYAPIALRIDYETAGKGDAGGDLTRRIFCTIMLQYENDQGAIVFAEEFNAESRDFIRKKDLNRVENRAYDFTIGPPLPSSTLKKMIEPSLITLITGGIIYVFYSFRSH